MNQKDNFVKENDALVKWIIALKAENARLQEQLDEHIKGVADNLLRDVIWKENEQLRADAERYRWLRDNQHGEGFLLQIWASHTTDLDKLIDEAMKE